MRLNEIKRFQKIAGLLNENDSDISTIDDLVEFLDSKPDIFGQYRDLEATYDDVIYNDVPSNLIQKYTGLTEKDIQIMDDERDTYSKSAVMHNGTVSIIGGE